MANITTNDVTITGSKEDRAEFMNLFEPYDYEVTFQALIPMPKSLDIPSSSEMQCAINYAVVMAGGEDGKPPLDMLKLLDPENEWGLRSKNGRYAKDCKEKLGELWERIKQHVELYSDDGSVDLNGDLAEVRLISGNESAKNRAEFLKYGQTAIDNLRQYGYTTWYGWCVDNWGCKWDAGDETVEEFDDEICIWFTTPWGPPEPIFEEIAYRFPKLTLDVDVEYEEGFRVHYHGENGVLTSWEEEFDEDEWDEEEYDEESDDEE